MPPRRASGARDALTADLDLASAQREMRQGNWLGAVASFRAVLGRREVPEALEGLAHAASFTNDLHTVFDARGRAYELYRRRADRRSAARVAIMIADDFVYVRGALAVARGWHRRAQRLLAGEPPGMEHALLACAIADAGLAAGEDPAALVRKATRAAALARSADHVELEMVALSIEGVARVLMGQIDRGMTLLDEAAAAAFSGEVEDASMSAYVLCYMLTACESARDVERARQWSDRASDHARTHALVALMAVAHTRLAGVLLDRGDWAEAARLLEAASRDFARARPALVAESQIKLASHRRRRGQIDEARALLAPFAHRPAAMLELAAIDLVCGDATAAARRTARLLRALPKADRLARARTLELAVRAALSRGRLDDATTALRELRAIARGSTSSLRAALLLAEGRVALATQRAEAARDAFERSIDLFRAAGVDVEAEAARTDLARALSALGDREGAAVESQAALAYFEPRGARDEVERARARAASTEAQADPSGAGRSQAGLSRREREVLRLLCDGRSNREIGRTLHISELTAKRHVQNILSKLDVPTRAAAAAFAARHGLA